MVDINKILKQWADGEKTLEETNEALKGTGLYVDPDKQKIAEGEGAVYCEDLSQINGYGLLDTGTGTLDKVKIKNGKLVQPIANSREQNVLAMVVLGSNILYIRDGKTLEH